MMLDLNLIYTQQYEDTNTREMLLNSHPMYLYLHHGFVTLQLRLAPDRTYSLTQRVTEPHVNTKFIRFLVHSLITDFITWEFPVQSYELKFQDKVHTLYLDMENTYIYIRTKSYPLDQGIGYRPIFRNLMTYDVLDHILHVPDPRYRQNRTRKRIYSPTPT